MTITPPFHDTNAGMTACVSRVRAAMLRTLADEVASDGFLAAYHGQ
ncbi:hypothetical protein RI103_10665 [Paraburkholderia sp. FT54]|nr:hypothetical protein [Paraburkholderia sp. FT54]WNC88202.1 hypothetical protein RI103_10665 [Paraburkholderia sp. FT54]